MYTNTTVIFCLTYGTMNSKPYKIGPDGNVIIV